MVIINGIDFETTGLNPKTGDKIIELGVSKWAFDSDPLTPGIEILKLEMLIYQPEIHELPCYQNGEQISPGLSIDHVKNIHSSQNLQSAAEFVRNGELMCAHNAKFERNFLEATNGSFSTVCFSNKWIDTSECFNEYLKYNKYRVSLDKLCLYANIARTVQHRAYGDSYDMMCAFSILRKEMFIETGKDVLNVI